MIIALRRGKHTDTIFYVVRQNRLHPRERVIVLEIEKGLQKYMEEDHSTPSSHTLLHMAAGLLPMAATPLSLFFSSLHVLTHCCTRQQGCCPWQLLLLSLLTYLSLVLFNPLTLLSNNCLFYRQTW